MSDTPLVSVVIPAYNAATVLDQAIDSVLQQTYPHIEIVVVDDGSTDETEALLARYGSRVRAHHQPNGGLACARNAGMARAQGDYIAWLDADDICREERIECQVAYLQQRPQVQLCSSNFMAFSAERRYPQPYLATYYHRVGRTANGLGDLYREAERLPLTTGAAPEPVATRRGAVFEALVYGNFVHPPTVMFRRELLVSVGPLLEDLRNVCDYEWLLRASLQGEFGFIERPLIDYRLSAGQMSSDANMLIIKSDLIRILDIVERLAPEFSRRHALNLKRRRGEAQLGVANALADLGRPGAWTAVYDGIRNDAPLPSALRLAAKLLTPRSLLRWRRSMRSGGTGGRGRLS